MIKFLLLFVSVFLFIGCSAKEQIKPNQKIFEDEDTYILFGLRAEQLGEYNISSSIFNTLYDKSQRKEYLYRSLQNDIAAKENEKVIQKVDAVTRGSLNDSILLRLKIIALIQLQRFNEAEPLALHLAQYTKTADDYLLAGEIYVKENKFDFALQYLEVAYQHEYNEKILDKISMILYLNLEKKKQAISRLEEHTRIHGCSKLICSKLALFYSYENDIDGLLFTYLRLYKIEADEEIAKKIVQIYEYKKDYLKLMDFLEESKSDDVTLLQLYSSTKNYKKAFVLADKLYATTADINYLGQSAIFEYESSEVKNQKEMLSRVVAKLEKLVSQQDTPLYINYLGYLLIDHEIDVKKGIEYINKVLMFEPNSAYYLDSLAWGYYKLGQCKKADAIMKKVVKLEGGDDKEVLSHIEAIQKCLNLKKKKVQNKQ
jgi:predicted Zn-dependent protease